MNNTPQPQPQPHTAPTPPTPGVDHHDAPDAQKIADLKRARSEREAAREAKKEKAIVEELVLEDKFERELGPRGVAFQLVDFTDVDGGFVAVKLGETVSHKKFVGSKGTDADAFDYVRPSIVHPSQDAYLKLQSTRGEVNGRVALALYKLHCGKLRDDAGK